MSALTTDSDDLEAIPENVPLDIKIEVDREVYFGGQLVTGVVRIINTVNRRLRGIKLTLKARAETRWFERSTPKASHTQYYNDWIFLNNEVYIYGDGTTSTLEAGMYNINFSIPITSNIVLPSSLEFAYGHIRYQIKVVVDWPWASAQEAEKYICVVNICDLSNIKESLQPATFTSSYKFGFPIRKVTIAGRLEKLAYVPGEEIFFQVEINNGSNKFLPFFLRLNQLVEYTSSDGKHKSSKYTVVENGYPPIKGKSDFSLEKEPLLVPPLPQSGIQLCSFLKLSYEAEIAVINNKETYKAVTIIYIGTIPVKEHYSRFKRTATTDPKVAIMPFANRQHLPLPVFKSTPIDPLARISEIRHVDPSFKLMYCFYLFDRDSARKIQNECEEEEEGSSEGSDVNTHFSY